MIAKLRRTQESDDIQLDPYLSIWDDWFAEKHGYRPFEQTKKRWMDKDPFESIPRIEDVILPRLARRQASPDSTIGRSNDGLMSMRKD